MPMIALSVVLLFRKPRRPRAIGCALAGLALISQLREAIDGIARMMSIAPDDHAMKLAMFRTIFNVLGVTLMLLLLDLLIGFLIRSIPPNPSPISVALAICAGPWTRSPRSSRLPCARRSRIRTNPRSS